MGEIDTNAIDIEIISLSPPFKHVTKVRTTNMGVFREAYQFIFNTIFS